MKNIIKSVKDHQITLKKIPISISAFIKKKNIEENLEKISLIDYDLVLVPGFIQWDTIELEEQYSIPIKKGTEFASDLPLILKNLDLISLSNKIPANKIIKLTGNKQYNQIIKDKAEKAKNEIDQTTFYINKLRSEIIIGENLPPPIIAEIVNCTNKSDQAIIKKAKYYIDSGAEIIDIGCIANSPDPERVREIIRILRNKFNILISIDSMNTEEIKVAINEDIDMILSLDLGNFKDFLDIPKDIPIVILPTNFKKGYVPKDPIMRIDNLFKLTEKLKDFGFTKLIADPILETPISPGIVNSLQAYYLYKYKTNKDKNKHLRLPLFFGISNVVELMDIDSVGINGILSSIAIELDIGIVFTTEHSPKLIGGVRELKQCIKLNYLSKHRKTPPINQGIQIFKAKGKTHQKKPLIDEKNAIFINDINSDYIPDEQGYFKIYINHYNNNIYVLFYSNNHKILKTIIGRNAEAISKKIISLNLINNLSHINYLGRELYKAELCLKLGKPFIQDET